MKVLSGTDIIEIDRIKDDIEGTGDRFLNRVFTENEINYCESKNINKYESYAARFAAKEAIYKALSPFINFEYTWKDFEVINEESGRPRVILHFEMNNIENIDLSLSHCNSYAVANVSVLIKE